MPTIFKVKIVRYTKFSSNFGGNFLQLRILMPGTYVLKAKMVCLDLNGLEHLIPILV